MTRAEAIVACSATKTSCKWITSNFIYELTPQGEDMILHWGRIDGNPGTETYGRVTKAFVNDDGNLVIELHDGELTLEFKKKEAKP